MHLHRCGGAPPSIPSILPPPLPYLLVGQNPAETSYPSTAQTLPRAPLLALPPSLPPSLPLSPIQGHLPLPHPRLPRARPRLPSLPRSLPPPFLLPPTPGDAPQDEGGREGGGEEGGGGGGEVRGSEGAEGGIEPQADSRLCQATLGGGRRREEVGREGGREGRREGGREGGGDLKPTAVVVKQPWGEAGGGRK